MMSAQRKTAVIRLTFVSSMVDAYLRMALLSRRGSSWC
jgi:hypothetical protein